MPQFITEVIPMTAFSSKILLTISLIQRHSKVMAKNLNLFPLRAILIVLFIKYSQENKFMPGNSMEEIQYGNLIPEFYNRKRAIRGKVISISNNYQRLLPFHSQSRRNTGRRQWYQFQSEWRGQKMCLSAAETMETQLVW